METQFKAGQSVKWLYQTGWGGGETRRADAKIIKVNRVKVRIEVLQKEDDHWVVKIKNVMPSSLELYPAANKSADGRDEHCRECSNWFLGCLNGREKWGDKAITQNYRIVQLEDGTCKHVCDAFALDPNPKRNGRVVSDGSW
jgi:uncharacterized FlgJ-related protein